MIFSYAFCFKNDFVGAKISFLSKQYKDFVFHVFWTHFADNEDFVFKTTSFSGITETNEVFYLSAKVLNLANN